MNTVKNFLDKYRKKLLLPVSLVLFAIVIFNLYYNLEVTPQSNDECLWLPTKLDTGKTTIIFDLVKFEGVAWQAGIRDGDELIEINHIKLKNTLQAQYLLNKVARGDSADYKIARNGQIFETRIKIKKLLNFGPFAVTLMALFWFIVGFVVINAKQSPTQILFYRIGALLVLYSTASIYGMPANYLSNPAYQYPWLLILIDIVWSTAAIFLPFLIIHFFWIFPRRMKIMKNPKTTKILYIIPVIIFFLMIIYKVGGIYLYKSDSLLVILGFVSFANLLVLIGLIVGLVSLFRNYLKLKVPRERNAIFIILISFSIGVASIIYVSTLANVFADTVFNSPEHYAPVILIAVLPVSFGYSIFKYSLMDVTDVIKNTIMYGLATITVAAVYFLVIYFIGQQLSSVIGAEYQGITAAGIFIVFAIVFQSTKDRFQEIITRKFYPEQFAAQKVLVKFSNDITTIVGIENILDSSAATFIDALKIERFGIALRNNPDDKIVLRRHKGINNENLSIQNDRNRIQKFIDNRIKVRQLAVIERNNFEEILPGSFEELIEENIFTIIPLVIKSKLTGLLLFGLKYSGSQFSGKDLELLVAASNQLAASLENARLYQSEAEKLKIDIDLENARKIQEKLLPGFIPSIPGLDIAGKMIPAMQVGGDYYDIIKISDQKIFVIVGDVSGKGLAASFYMSKLQTMIQLNCKLGRSPKEVLLDVNKEIYGTIEKNWFITVSVALFDIGARTVTISRAGHTPMIVVEGEHHKIYQPTGIGIGLEKGEIFNESLEELEIPLNDNSLFVLFSDGVNETMNSEDNLYGMQKFTDVLVKSAQMRAESALTNILNSLEKFRGGIPHNDDITLVLVKYQESK